MGIERIVVGSDGWSTAAAAVERAASLARSADAELTVVYGYSEEGAQPAGLGKVAERPSPSDVGQGIIDAVRKRYPDIRVAGHIREGSPSDAINASAGEIGANLIVVGNKGIGSFLQRITTSVANQLAHAPTADLLVVHTTDGKHPELVSGEDRSTPYAKIVVGYDGSQTAGRAVAAADVVAKATGADLRVIIVGEPDWGDGVAADLTRAYPHLAGHAETVQGEPVDALLTAVNTHRADLLVLGNKGLEERHLLRPIPEKLVREASTDVMIVRTSA